MGTYLAPVWHTILPKYRDEFGYIDTVFDGTGGVKCAAENGKRWMLDNGVYSGSFDADRWLKQIEWYAQF